MTTERPILFSAPMVRAIQEDRKTNTRRTRALEEINKNPAAWEIREIGLLAGRWAATFVNRQGDPLTVFSPYGGPGDRLWVRETFRVETFPASKSEPLVHYRADDTAEHHAWSVARMWKPSIHMPRWASRLLLEVVDVRVERVQEISPRDIVAEGLYHEPGEWAEDSAYAHMRPAFGQLWNEINARRGFGWDANPWVWVITFRRVEP